MNNEYQSMGPNLPQLPAVSRQEIGNFGSLPIIEKLIPLVELDWRTSQYHGSQENSWKVTKGNFNDGETIQVTAPANSLYGAHGLVPLADIEPASSERNYRMLREWLSTCMASHESCRSSHSMTDDPAEDTTLLPTRVIDLGSLEETGLKPRLFTSNKASGLYIALSHRWSKKIVAKLKRENLSQYEKELPVDGMPPTFRDAIEVTRQLGFRYLWIDSLCIIQDDELDWFQESKKMGAIFEEAACTIAAVDSVDDDGIDRGLFLSRDIDPLSIRFTLPYKKVPLKELSERVFRTEASVYIWKVRWLREKPTLKTCDKNTITIRPRIVSAWNLVSRSNWHKRGWVLQERLLSRRLIYFTKEKLSWSCFTKSGDEEGGDPKDFARPSLLPVRSGSELPKFATWQRIISDYQGCQLTFSKDRLAAISGISARLESYFSCNIYAGILHHSSHDTAKNLLWYARKTSLRTVNEFHAPSWSWVALYGEISFLMLSPGGHDDLLITGLSFKIRNQCESMDSLKDCEGTCVSGSVSFEGPVQKLIRSTKLKDLRTEGCPNEPITEGKLLAQILGPNLVSDFAIPRFDELGNELPRPYNSLVPDHTEILVEECGCIVGFFIPDLESEPKEARGQLPIMCVGIKRWQARSRQQEDTIDILGLRETCHSTMTFQRLGRGRVICSGWLQKCETMSLTII